MSYKISLENFIFENDGIDIQYIKESNLLAYKFLPVAFFGDKEFEQVSIIEDTISIDIREWLPFYQKVLKLTDGDKKLLQTFITNMKYNLEQYNICVDKCRGNVSKRCGVKATDVENLLRLFSVCQAYAFWNFFSSDIFSRSDTNVQMNNYLVSLVPSHRTIVQLERMRLANRYIIGELKDEDISHYIDNEFVLSKEIEWHYSYNESENKRIVLSELASVVQSYNNTIEKEMDIIIQNREHQLKKLKKQLCALRGNDFYKGLLLVNLATQEEIRHMINCKMMNIVSCMCRICDIDVFTSSSQEMARTFELIEHFYRS
jgi:hypothetical protein